MAPTHEALSNEADYAVLKPKVAYLSKNTLRKKYKRLPYLQHAATRDLLQDLEKQSKSGARRTKIDPASEACLHELTTRLIEKLPRIPFPPKTEETHFDHESNIRHIGRLEEQLNHTKHSTTLLRAQIERERVLLEGDRAECEQLEKSLRSNEGFRKEQLRSLHPLARSMGSSSQTLDLLDLDQKSKADDEPDLSDIQVTDEIAPLLKTLSDHLRSIEGSTANIATVSTSLEGLLQQIDECEFVV